MTTNKPTPIEKTAKEILLKNHIRDLDRRIFNVQDEMVQMGIDIVSAWLSDADREDIFEESVDWLMGSEAQEEFESQRGTMAFESVKYAVYQFENREEEDQDDEEDEEDEDDEETNSSKLYDDVREFFNV